VTVGRLQVQCLPQFTDPIIIMAYSNQFKLHRKRRQYLAEGRSLCELYPAGLAAASTHVKYRGLDGTAQRQQPCWTENWSFSVRTDITGVNIEEELVWINDRSVDLSSMVRLYEDNVCIDSNNSSVSASVTYKSSHNHNNAVRKW